MEAGYAMHQAPMPGTSPFYYYNPDPDAQNGQHGHFSPHPSEMHTGNGQVHVLPNQPMPHPHPHPHQHQHQHQQPHQNGYAHGYGPQAHAQNLFHAPGTMTPTASPQPLHMKPSIVLHQESQALFPLDTNCSGNDLYGFPSTPPLSTSGSTISSPPSSCGMVHTPVNGGFSHLETIEGVKEGCEGDVQTELLGNLDWTRSASPPMTPVFVHPPGSSAGSADESSQEGLSRVSTAVSCPPSPSPSLLLHPQQPTPLSSQPASSDFCDPRQLTVGSSASSAADFPPLPSLSTPDDDHHNKLDLDASLHSHALSNVFADSEHGEDTLGALPSFDSFSDLDSEDEFVNEIANNFTPTDHTFFLGDKRRRIGLYSADEDDFASEQSLEDLEDVDFFAHSGLPRPDVPLPASVPATGTMKTKKRSTPRKPAKRSSSANSDTDSLASIIKAAQANVNNRGQSSQADGSPSAQEANADNDNTNANANGAPNHETSESNPQTSNSETPAAPVAPVARRGRKQSLTDDPSKTFVCNLCSRRFRRQEHLKRHYRSLHTHDKPFECGECGKKFSRSDNLAQHARIHSSGAIVMGVLEPHEVSPQQQHPHQSFEEHDAGALGAVLYEAAHAAANKSTTSESSDDSLRGTESPTPLDRKRPAKKRKREESS